MAKKKAISQETKSTQQNAYSVVLSFGDVGCGSSGDTIEFALSELKPTVIKSMGLLSVTKGDKKAEIDIRPFQVKKMLVNKFYRIILDKRLNMLMK